MPHGSAAPPGAADATASRQPPGAHDPRVTVPTNSPATNRGTGPVPWIIAGAAALAIVGVFLATQTSGPGQTVITVSHPGSGGP
jgi:hypothetical protein